MPPEPRTLQNLSESADWQGYRANMPGVTSDYLRRLDRCVALIENRDGLPTHRWEYELREAMTTDDFPNLFGDTINRELLSHYKAAEPNLLPILRQRTVSDFKPIKTFRKGGFLTMSLQEVTEKGEYLASTIDVEQTEYELKKYGRQVDFSWEAYLNDDLGLFSDIGQDLGQAVINTENRHITSMFFAAAGPIAATFGNAAAATGGLRIGTLETGVEAMLAYTHPDTAEPINNWPKYLMVPPALEMTARQILGSTHKMWLADADHDVAALGSQFALPTTNVISQIGLQLIVNPWMPVINTTTPATAWALFSDPAQIAAGEFARLRGHESPEIWMKSADAVQVGGGAVSPFQGDFATDNIFYRIRHVFQGQTVEPRAAYASTGTT